jgi:hypothetical protein
LLFVPLFKHSALAFIMVCGLVFCFAELQRSLDTCKKMIKNNVVSTYFILDKMDLKKIIDEFRQFQLERRGTILKKIHFMFW